jgi:hypothetical protein
MTGGNRDFLNSPAIFPIIGKNKKQKGSNCYASIDSGGRRSHPPPPIDL